MEQWMFLASDIPVEYNCLDLVNACPFGNETMFQDGHPQLETQPLLSTQEIRHALWFALPKGKRFSHVEHREQNLVTNRCTCYCKLYFFFEKITRRRTWTACNVCKPSQDSQSGMESWDGTQHLKTHFSGGVEQHTDHKESHVSPWLSSKGCECEIVHTCIHKYMHACMHTCKHVCMYVCMKFSYTNILISL